MNFTDVKGGSAKFKDEEEWTYNGMTGASLEPEQKEKAHFPSSSLPLHIRGDSGFWRPGMGRNKDWC